MKIYEKPIVLTNEELSEGVYAASGDVSAKACDSKYMNGIWQAQNSSLKGDAGYKAVYGCLGCPANRFTSCGLLTDYVDNNQASSYDTDKGKRKPAWEWNGYGPDDFVTDWGNCGNQSGSDLS